MNQTQEILRVVLANPGLDAADIMDLAKGVGSGTTCASALKYLTDKGEISRAGIDGRFCYWPPGEAPETVAEPVKEKGWPGVNIDRASKARNRAEDARPANPDPERLPTKEEAKANRMQEREQDHRPVKTYPLSAVQEAPQPAKQTAAIVTPNWVLYPIEDGLIVMHKDSDTGFRLDAETVAAIKELV